MIPFTVFYIESRGLQTELSFSFFTAVDPGAELYMQHHVSLWSKVHSSLWKHSCWQRNVTPPLVAVVKQIFRLTLLMSYWVSRWYFNSLGISLVLSSLVHPVRVWLPIQFGVHCNRRLYQQTAHCFRRTLSTTCRSTATKISEPVLQHKHVYNTTSCGWFCSGLMAKITYHSKTTNISNIIPPMAKTQWVMTSTPFMYLAYKDSKK